MDCPKRVQVRWISKMAGKIELSKVIFHTVLHHHDRVQSHPGI
jgi:hypothetical protein